LRNELIVLTNRDIQDIKDLGRKLFKESESTARIADTQIYFILQGLHELLRAKGVTPNFTVEANTQRYTKNYEGAVE
jgi:hypothetical protein